MLTVGVAGTRGSAAPWRRDRAGSAGTGRLCPGMEVFGAGLPGQEPFEARAWRRLAAVASAGVEVSGEIGEGVEAGHLGGGGDSPGRGGKPGGVLVPGPAGVTPGHDGQADR